MQLLLGCGLECHADYSGSQIDIITVKPFLYFCVFNPAILCLLTVRFIVQNPTSHNSAN
jgi:hypothetical protein